MVPNSILPDDPRLTAYALGELDPAECAEFETLLRQDPAAQRLVAEIRATAGTLSAALMTEIEEPELPIAAAPRAAAASTAVRRHDAGPAEPERVLPKSIKFPQFYYFVSGLAAAGFAVFFVFWQRDQPAHLAKKYIEVPLTAAAPAVESEAAEAKVGADANTPAQVTLLAKDGAFAGNAGAVADALHEARVDRAKAEVAARSAAPQKLARAKVAASAAGAPAAAPTGTESEDKLVLSPFTVSAPEAGYVAGSTLAGSRVNAVTRDLGLSITRPAPEPANTEAYTFHRDNSFLRVADQPLSTFSVDVDTASYANVRRFLQAGQVPPADAVRIEELVNYFPYRYAGPSEVDARGDASQPPFAAHLEVASAPWAPEHRLVRIGLKGREISEAARPAANLVFLIDVSGSMDEPRKLPLVKQALKLLVEKLRADDRVALTVYAGGSGLVLPSTPVARKAEILSAIEQLDAGGSTNGAMGIQLAYDIAKANFVAGGVNRVILATDGDFNVGVTSEGELVRLVQEKAKSGVFLSVLGFGMGNLKDSTLEQLADQGNGNYAYIDSVAEARKTLVEQAGGTLVTIAKDVKLQVEFNPATVAAYRLIGYENRLLAKEDFNNDQVDAGEIGAGHTVTALYEVIPAGGETPDIAGAGVDALKYQRPVAGAVRREGAARGELLTLKVRYKQPASDVSEKLEFPLVDGGARFDAATPDFKFASAVAAFGMALRDSPQRGLASLTDIAAWARAGIATDVGGYRSEFVDLVGRLQALRR